MNWALGPVCLTVLALDLAVPVHAAPQGVVPLASHRAVYDLKLAETRGKRPIQAVRGRILYDFSGSPCEGYALQFRQVSELDNGEGKASVSDLRATTWEDGTGKRLRFFSENYLDNQLRDVVDGEAERLRNRVGVKLTKPADKRVELEIDPVFPTEHVRHIIAAARDRKTLFESVVYDGSESGEKLYDTLTVIGQAIPPGGKLPGDAAAKQPALEQMTRWPVTISYFDRSKKGGEQVPVYAITLELYENGVSRALKLDYGDFVLSGEMTQIEFRDVKACQ